MDTKEDSIRDFWTAKVDPDHYYTVNILSRIQRRPFGDIRFAKASHAEAYAQAQAYMYSATYEIGEKRDAWTPWQSLSEVHPFDHTEN